MGRAKECTHGTINTHSDVTHLDIRLWRCSTCGHRASWGPGWECFANLECKRCGWQAIESVICPACAESTPTGKG